MKPTIAGLLVAVTLATVATDGSEGRMEPRFIPLIEISAEDY